MYCCTLLWQVCRKDYATFENDSRSICKLCIFKQNHHPSELLKKRSMCSQELNDPSQAHAKSRRKELIDGGTFAICQFCFCYLTLLVLISSCPTSYATAKFVPGCHESSWSSWRERASCVAKLFPPKNIWRSTTVPSTASSSKIGKQKAYTTASTNCNEVQWNAITTPRPQTSTELPAAPIRNRVNRDVNSLNVSRRLF